MIQQDSYSCKTAVERRGIAMMLVMVAILVTGGMAVAYFGSRDNSIAISTNVASSSSARVVAESGLDIAVAILETNADWRNNHVDGVILDEYQIGEGTVSITIIDAETDAPPTETTLEVLITVAATVEGRIQYTEASATIVPDDDEFDIDYSEFAIFAQNRISVRGASSVQNWAASPMSSQHAIQIGTLSTSPMSVQINSLNQQNTLSLHAPEHASSMISTSSTFTTEFTDALPYLQPPAPPSDVREFSFMLAPDSEEDDDDDVSTRWVERFISNDSHTNRNFSQTTSIHEGSYELDEFALTPNQNIVIYGEVTLVVRDDLVMTNANITLAKDATLTIHIGGDVDIQSSYIGNEDSTTQAWMDPSRVQLYGHGDADWNISGRSTLKAELYAPRSDIDIRGLSTICGRLAGEDVSLRNASRVLYDQTLNNGGFADSDSGLYDDDGSLINEIRQLTELNPALLNSIESAITAYDDDNDEFQFGSYRTPWNTEPTNRPHEVVYALLVYGVDTGRWEEMARHAYRAHHGTFAWADDR